MRRHFVAVIAAGLALPLLAAPALAHERRAVGQYEFEVGWLSEPAFAGQVNAIDITVTDTTKNDAPVEGLEQTLRAEVFFGGLTTALPVPLRAQFGLPGKYAGDLVPTKQGGYTFRIFGKIGSLNVDERFESGPGRFEEVQALTALQYPAAVPAGADLLDRLSALQSGLDQLRALSIAGVVIALSALGLGAWRRVRA